MTQDSKNLLAITGNAVLVEYFAAGGGPEVKSGADQVSNAVIPVQHKVMIPDSIGIVPGFINPARQADITAVGVYPAFVLVLDVVLTVYIQACTVYKV